MQEGPPPKKKSMLDPIVMLADRWEKEYQEFFLEIHLKCQVAGMVHFWISFE